jgi:CO/xanthine dehydrogenase FAD-binding subunit
LHGEPDVLGAMAKLAARCSALREELEAKDRPHADYEEVTTRTLQGHRYPSDERREIDQGLRLCKRLIQRMAEIDDQLKVIERDGGLAV